MLGFDIRQIYKFADRGNVNNSLISAASLLKYEPTAVNFCIQFDHLMQQPHVIFWFRRDLRLNDNIGLFHALKSGQNVLPIFIFDTNILTDLPKDDARITFIVELLSNINSKLVKKGSSLAVFHGKPYDIFTQLIRNTTLSAVYSNQDYEPYAVRRDAEISELLQKNAIDFRQFKDQVIFGQNEVVKDDGTPYVVFTPYSKKWKQKLAAEKVVSIPSETLPNFATHSYPFLTTETIGFKPSAIKVPPFRFDSLQNYEATRNFPAVAGTTGLSPHLRFGAISIRTAVKVALNHETFLNELIWREFFMQILWHFPDTVRHSFRPKYDAIKWRNNETEFKKWCDGNTGYPIVDAGMRELNATGFMQNRVRMITASFLCKHLLIDWRWGETYFALKLLDYEQASNVGNWQWAAGSGVDAAPYFRIFNPSEQTKKFDSKLQYIRKWVPEFEDFSYPEPIVDHKEARERCVRVYKEALG